MSSVLLVVNEEAQIRELARVADLCAMEANLRPVVFMEDRLRHLGTPVVYAERQLETLTSEGFTGGNGRAALGIAPEERGAVENPSPVKRWLTSAGLRLPSLWQRKAANMGLKLATDDLQYVEYVRNHIFRRAAVCDAVLSQRPYAALVLCEDNVELDTAVWIFIARRRCVRSVIVPYTISNTMEFAESYVHHKPYRVDASLANQAVAERYPHWVIEHRNRRFLRSSYARIAAMESLGLAPPNPWLLNSGFADAIAVESEAMHDYYRAAGIPEQQLVMTGSLSDDVIVEVLANAPQRRGALLESFGLSDGKPLLLCCLPPDQNTFDRPGCDFQDFDDMLEFFGTSLRAVSRANVIVRPHPKTPPERVRIAPRQGAGGQLRRYGGARPFVRSVRCQRVGDDPLGDRVRQAGDKLRSLPLRIHGLSRRAGGSSRQHAAGLS